MRRRCFTLPSKDFTFGMRSVCLDGGAHEGDYDFFHKNADNMLHAV